MKRLLTVITLCLLTFGVIFPFTTIASENKVLLVDDAGVLTTNQYDELLTKLNQTSAQYNTDVAAITVNGTGNTDIGRFADQYFLDHGYGRNVSGDGILFVIDVLNRNWHITTHGDTIYSFTDAGIERMGDEVVQYLSNNDYAGAINEYCDLAAGMIDYRNREGHAYLQDEEVAEEHNDPEAVGLKGIIGAVAGLLGSLGITRGMKNQLTSVRSKSNAADYFNPAQLKLRGQKDTFLYTNVTRILIRDDSDKGGGGGFSTHTTGGSTFGGGGGKF